MICPTCKNPIRDGLLACPGCTARNAAVGIAKAQGEYLRRVVKGEWDLQVARANAVSHAVLFHAPNQAYCKFPLSSNAKRSRMPWAAVESAVDDPAKAREKELCTGCCLELQAMVKEAFNAAS